MSLQLQADKVLSRNIQTDRELSSHRGENQDIGKKKESIRDIVD
jgi:hypothetical protein